MEKSDAVQGSQATMSRRLLGASVSILLQATSPEGTDLFILGKDWRYELETSLLCSLFYMARQSAAFLACPPRQNNYGSLAATPAVKMISLHDVIACSWFLYSTISKDHLVRP